VHLKKRFSIVLDEMITIQLEKPRPIVDQKSTRTEPGLLLTNIDTERKIATPTKKFNLKSKAA
jgi:hypothetical protein